MTEMSKNEPEKLDKALSSHFVSNLLLDFLQAGNKEIVHTFGELGARLSVQLEWQRRILKVARALRFHIGRKVGRCTESLTVSRGQDLASVDEM